MRAFRKTWPLLASTALTTVLASGAMAQTAPNNATATKASDVLAEVVITATRQTDTVNHVPLSVSAVTQSTLDKQGIKNVQDLARVVPGLAFRVTGADSVPQIAIRGIAATGGSQTTAVYLDDVPLQKRGLGGSPYTGSGTPLPQLFDLDRVEVLKGPQGTLYGGSAEGGAVRFITPAPSLTTFSGIAKAEGSVMKEGSPGYDLGVAVGGPIVQDKLGFRASFRNRRIGGYIDEVSRFDGSVVNPDTNYDDDRAFRGALLWKPTDRLSITPSVYFTSQRIGDIDTFWENIAQTTVPTRSYTATGKLTTDPTQTAFTLPGHTYAATTAFGVYRNGSVSNVGDNYAGKIPLAGLTDPSNRTLRLWSNNIQYDFDGFKANLITSYSSDQSKGHGDVSFQPVFAATGYPFLYSLPYYFTTIAYNDVRQQQIDELRFTSDAGKRLTWVGGLYYSQSHLRSYDPSYWNANDLTEATKGITDVQTYGVPLLNSSTYLTGVRDQRVHDSEIAGYANADFMITDKLKATAGVRYARVEVYYKSYNYGQATGTSIPTVANGGYVEGKSVENPVTPKFGLSYQADPNTLVFVNAAKGYRPGGVNLPASASLCATDFTALNITSTPLAYGSDSVWSYEGGFKARIFNRAQLNASLFYIDWNTPQTTVTLPSCGNSYLINAGKAVSKGFDAQLTAKVVGGLSVSGAVAYTDAYQKEAVGLNTPTHPLFVAQGDGLPVPKWSGQFSAQYDYEIMDQYASFVRFDWQFTGKYQRSSGPGTTSFAPDSYIAKPTYIASLRGGVTVKAVEFDLFVNNLFNSQDLLSFSGGRSGCAVATGAACSTFGSYNPEFTGSTFRPREIGADVTYKF